MKQLLNPFKFTNDCKEEDNILWETDIDVDHYIEDIIVGCVRSFKSDVSDRQEYVNWYKVYKLYRDVNELTVTSIKSYFRCSDRQVTRYVTVLKLCTPFIKQHYRTHPHEY